MRDKNEGVTNNRNLLSTITIAVIIAVILFIIKSLFFKDRWRLMICSSLMENGIECRENSYVLEGYKSQNECMEKGISLEKGKGFECGKNCRELEYGGAVCEVICNKAGCSRD